jgi:hypothetical protein
VGADWVHPFEEETRGFLIPTGNVTPVEAFAVLDCCPAYVGSWQPNTNLGRLTSQKSEGLIYIAGEA